MADDLHCQLVSPLRLAVATLHFLAGHPLLERAVALPSQVGKALQNLVPLHYLRQAVHLLQQQVVLYPWDLVPLPAKPVGTYQCVLAHRVLLAPVI